MLLLEDIVLILFIAILIILVLLKFKIPPVIGFLITGSIVNFRQQIHTKLGENYD